MAVQGEGTGGQERGEVEGVVRAASHPGSGRIPELDGIRGIAILLVILCHYVGNADHRPLGVLPHRFLSAFTAGWSGVDLFFVLSGFLIGGILLDARTSPRYFRAFYIRRVFRILPVYYTWIFLYALLVGGALWLLPGRYPAAPRDLLQVPIQLLFLRNILIGNMPFFALMWFVVTWSLAVEEQFYLVAPPLIRFLSTRQLFITLIATISLAPLLRFFMVHYFPSKGTAAAFFPMPCRADALAWGILLALAWRAPAFRAFLDRRLRFLKTLFLVFLLGTCALIWWFAHPLNIFAVTVGLSWLAAFYASLLLVVLSQTHAWLGSLCRHPLLCRLGAISYCVYILHDTFNFLAHKVLLRAAPQIYTWQGVATSLLALLLTLAVASLSWRFFEQPLIRRGHQYSYADTAPASEILMDTAPAQP